MRFPPLAAISESEHRPPLRLDNLLLNPPFPGAIIYQSMAKKNPFSRYPSQVRASTERPDVRYVHLAGHFAIHGKVPPSLASSVVWLLNEENIAVCRGEAGDQPADSESVTLSPVYALGADGPAAVPTGLILVRFKESVRIEERHEALARAGYTVRQTLAYAPHAAWVQASSGGIAEALTGIATLETLPDVVNVEPQMLTERVPR